MQFAAYGTLRKGSYNYDRYKTVFGDDFEYVSTVRVKDLKYSMVNLGPYPALCANATPHDITFDIIECSNEAFETIDQMESGAGYVTESINIEGKTYPIFVLNHQYRAEEVKDGDWIAHEKKLLA